MYTLTLYTSCFLFTEFNKYEENLFYQIFSVYSLKSIYNSLLKNGIESQAPKTYLILIFTPKFWEWTSLRGTAIPSWSVIGAEQALNILSSFKNRINIVTIQWTVHQILNWWEQILHFDLSQRPRSDKVPIEFWFFFILVSVWAAFLS